MDTPTSPNSQTTSSITIGGELTFVKTNLNGELETVGFHSKLKRNLSLFLANKLAEEFNGVAFEYAEIKIPDRCAPYAEVKFISENTNHRDLFSNYCNRIFIRPDVDVIEVNLPPTTSIEQCESNIAKVYACALAAGLTPTLRKGKRCVGSRGGFHLTFSCIGVGIDARIQTLNLAIGFLDLTSRWPFLSYLFCGDRSGVDGFHPRLDEVAVDAKERLQAMRGIAALYEKRARVQPDCWPSIATAMTKLLRDRFGHSHVVEISLDKIWSSNPTRNLQVVEIRQLEMTDVASLAIAQARFFWVLAHKIKQNQINLKDFSSERCNPDILDAEFLRFSELHQLHESGVSTNALLQISVARYPALLEVEYDKVNIRLRLGRVESFCEYNCIGAGEIKEIFVPYKLTFSLRVIRKYTSGDSSVVCISLNLLDHFFDIRDIALRESYGASPDIMDIISAETAQHIKSISMAIINRNHSNPIENVFNLFEVALNGRNLYFSLAGLKFCGTLRVESFCEI
jgi:hypothetical protein